jgi:opacity protein-like surface antigen
LSRRSFLLLALPLLCLASAAKAIDPSEIILTLDGAYGRPMGPQRYADGYYGYGGLGMLERKFNNRYSLGIAFQTMTFTELGGDRVGMSALDLVGRRWFGKWKGFNPYLLAGLGGNLFKDAHKKPFGDVFHAQLALGSQYVLDTHWAIDYAVEWHVMAPLDTPHHWPGVRFGLSYRYGTQPRVNRIAPPPVLATGMEVLPREKVAEIVGRMEYTVQPGDSLYRIAGKPQTYKRPVLWPLVYSANSGKIVDPHLIQPNQVLIVQKNYSNDEAELARKVATSTTYQRPTAQKKLFTPGPSGPWRHHAFHPAEDPRPGRPAPGGRPSPGRRDHGEHHYRHGQRQRALQLLGGHR